MHRTRKAWSRAALATVLGVVSVAVLGGGASAAAPPHQQFIGKTSQGLPMEFRVVKTPAHRLIVFEFQVAYKVECDVDGAHQGWVVGFGGYPIEIQNGQFDFDYLDPFASIDFSGSITMTQAAGLTRWAVPEFTRDEVVQKCESPDVAWMAAPAPLGAAPVAWPDADRRVTLMRDASGKVSITQGEPAG
jgi:hypothetical protein